MDFILINLPIFMLFILLFTLFLGLIAGILSGLLGLGGGIILVPALIWLYAQLEIPAPQIMIMAIATSLSTISITSVSSILSHHKLGNILWPQVFKMVPGIIVGACTGAIAATYINAEMLKIFFIAYLTYTGIRMGLTKSVLNSKPRNLNRFDFIFSIVTGFLSSLLGIGGGTLTVPYLAKRQFQMKNAVAISTCCGFPISIAASISYIFLGHQQTNLPDWSFGYVYLPAFIGISACSILTAPAGAYMAQYLPAQKIKRYFSFVLLLVACKMAYQAGFQ